MAARNARPGRSARAARVSAVAMPATVGPRRPGGQDQSGPARPYHSPVALAPTGPELLLDLDSSGPLRERVEEALRHAIRDGRLRPGDRLPATRALAAELGCSRWVVVEAYAQLAAEGWLEGRAGSGTRVRARDAAPGPGVAQSAAEPPPPGVLPRARFDFTLGLPDLVA